MKKEWIEGALGKGWDVTPAGGATGEAYYASREETKLFLKVNASPFLAVLSAEGLVPKLVWTKRIENGDVISAQQWLDSRKLKPEEMNTEEIAFLLQKIHTSSDLLEMLNRIHRQVLLPTDLLATIQNQLTQEQLQNSSIAKAIHYLNEQTPTVQLNELVVCHCDLNHHNFLRASNGKLYLVDWDSACIADPALDLAMLLHWYIPKAEWKQWLNTYGVTYTEDLKKRMQWYIVAQTVYMYQWFSMRQNEKEATFCFQNLLDLLQQYNIG
ncbi:MAG: phosphotransferase family protein [Bacillaceae bacterium]